MSSLKFKLNHVSKQNNKGGVFSSGNYSARPILKFQYFIFEWQVGYPIETSYFTGQRILLYVLEERELKGKLGEGFSTGYKVKNMHTPLTVYCDGQLNRLRKWRNKLLDVK